MVMKILHVIDSGGLYGAETMLLHLMTEQLSMGLFPILASIGAPDEKEKPLEMEARQRGLAVVSFRMRSGPNWVGALTILRYARQEKIDVLHSHGYKGNILFGPLPQFIRDLPMVTTLHGWTSLGGFCRMRLYELAECISFHFVDCIVLVNEAMRTSPPLKNLPSEKLAVVENGIPLETNKKGSRLCTKLVEFTRKRFTFLAIGRLSPEKGFDILLEALTLVTATGIDVQLVIFGEGEERSQLEEKIHSLQLENRVLLPGFLAEVKDYLPLFDAFVLPSLTEGLPMVLLEAMAAGIPIVASRVGGIPKALDEGRGGILVSASDSDNLHRAMLSICTDISAARERAVWASRCVRERYNSRTMAKKYSQIYEGLLLKKIEKRHFRVEGT